MTEESKAFFSYSRLDAEFALKLAKDLRNAGASVWLDQLDISPGSHWDVAIQKAVGSSSSLLVVLSPHSVESENVMDEVSYAIEEKKLVIPVLYRKCDIPFRLRRVQYIDVQTDYEGGLQKILTQLQVHQKTASGPAAQDTRATTAEWETAQARAAAQAHEREQAEKAAQLRAAQERIAREEAERRAQYERAQQAQSRAAAAQGVPFGAVPPVRPASSKKWVIWAAGGAFIFLVLLIAAISNLAAHKNPDIQQPSPNTSAAATIPSSSETQPAPARSVPTGDQPSSTEAARPDLHQWLLEMLNASQGPAVGPLKSFFDDTVSPYHSLSSANWSEIAADKQAYFNRFPEIHYQLLFWRHTPQPDGSEQIECDVQYNEVRNDGVLAHGVSHFLIAVRLQDGQWKITGIH